MSHFTVLVIGKDVDKQLQPYHEYECTGIEDQYVVNVNKNDEVNRTLSREVFIGLKKDGTLDYYFSQESADENLTNIEKTTMLDFYNKKGLTQDQIDSELSDDLGVTKLNGDYVRYTNPNAKWDWWVIGGRWSGFFKLKNGGTGKTGKVGAFGTPPEKGYVDSLMKKDLDIVGMRDEAELKAKFKYDIVWEGIKDTPKNLSWDHVRDVLFNGNVNEARTYYHQQPRVMAFKGVCDKHKDTFGYFSDVEEYNVDRDEYIKRARNGAISTYAVVIDSVWYSKGKMGWFGMSNNDMTDEEWSEKINQYIDECSDETLLTLVDCHI